MDTKVSFDELLKEVSDEYCAMWQEEFLAVDTSQFPITPAIRRRFKRMLKAEKKQQCPKPRTVSWKAILAACLILLSACITACVAIPRVRNAIKRVFVEWFDDYVAVGFVEETVGDGAQTTQAPTLPASTPQNQTPPGPQDTPTAPEQQTPVAEKPTAIVKKAYATYLPGEYACEVDVDTTLFYMISYYEQENLQISVSQHTITKQLVWADSEQQNLEYVKVNGFNAIMLEDTSEPDLYSIIWQDNEYEYHMDGYFSSVDELIKVAEGIKVK